MGAPEGGEAPSVEAKIRTAAAAIGIGTPTPARARTATGPTAAMVALAVSGMAIATTMSPMAMAMIQAGACRSASTVDSWSARPRSARTLEAENAATMVMPMTPNAGATLPSVDHQLFLLRGRLFRPKNSTRPIISTGIQVIRLTTSDMAYGT